MLRSHNGGPTRGSLYKIHISLRRIASRKPMAGVAPPRAVARLGFVHRLIQRNAPCRKQRKHCTSRVQPKDFPMMDVVMLGFAIGLFALAIGYTYACERL